MNSDTGADMANQVVTRQRGTPYQHLGEFPYGVRYQSDRPQALSLELGQRERGSGVAVCQPA